MGVDRLLAALAVIAVTAFLAILAVWVPLADLVICMGIVVALIAWDFYDQLVRRRPEEGGPV